VRRLRIAVAGLWHLGIVTAACLAADGHDVVGWDSDSTLVDGLLRNRLPIAESGLADLVKSQVSRAKLRFSSQLTDVRMNDVLWVCFDTPLNENDTADVSFVHNQILRLLPELSDGTQILISSQVPVGSTAHLEAAYKLMSRPRGLSFAYSPENLQLGRAIEAFTDANRIVVGVRPDADREPLNRLLGPLTKEICWMSVESAEMTKLALNAFLGSSVAFINDVAVICEKTGADALEVERGLKTDNRIGPRAYLHAGAAFGGGTLGRDIAFLLKLADRHGIEARLLRGLKESNDIHKTWAQRRLLEVVDDMPRTTIAVLGLTYKPGTDTLRGSNSIEFCRWASERGGSVTAFDPRVSSLPPRNHFISLKRSAAEALYGADVALIATPWPEFRDLQSEVFAKNMRRATVLDPSRFLERNLNGDARIKYIAVGKGNEIS